jgi:hypothetical protein
MWVERQRLRQSDAQQPQQDWSESCLLALVPH